MVSWSHGVRKPVRVMQAIITWRDAALGSWLVRTTKRRLRDLEFYGVRLLGFRQGHGGPAANRVETKDPAPNTAGLPFWASFGQTAESEAATMALTEDQLRRPKS